jgi:predicted kinase
MASKPKDDAAQSERFEQAARPPSAKMLIVFGGLPGAGKTTISRAVASQLAATYLRVDTIEQAIRNAGVVVGATGYAVAQAIAQANLCHGHKVVADCVNPVRESRDAWRAAAARAGAPILEVEVRCSDVAEHRRRVMTRTSDIPGLIAPTWDDVTKLNYETWDGPRLAVDTAKLSPAEAVALVIAAAAAHGP